MHLITAVAAFTAKAAAAFTTTAAAAAEASANNVVWNKH
jgi:hypothetical protein